MQQEQVLERALEPERAQQPGPVREQVRVLEQGQGRAQRPV